LNFLWSRFVPFASLLISLVAASSAGASTADSKPDPAIRGKLQQCVACHGATGVSVDPTVPIVAGQHKPYLITAIRSYQSGERKHATMRAMVGHLSARDIELIAEFYSKQSPAKTP
jgi:cytochrome c553